MKSDHGEERVASFRDRKASKENRRPLKRVWSRRASCRMLSRHLQVANRTVETLEFKRGSYSASSYYVLCRCFDGSLLETDLLQTHFNINAEIQIYMLLFQNPEMVDIEKPSHLPNMILKI